MEFKGQVAHNLPVFFFLLVSISCFKKLMQSRLPDFGTNLMKVKRMKCSTLLPLLSRGIGFLRPALISRASGYS